MPVIHYPKTVELDSFLWWHFNAIDVILMMEENMPFITAVSPCFSREHF